MRVIGRCAAHARSLILDYQQSTNWFLSSLHTSFSKFCCEGAHVWGASGWKLEPPHDKTNKMTCAQRRLPSAWASADAQADLSFHWAHMPYCWFSHAAAHFLLIWVGEICQQMCPQSAVADGCGFDPHVRQHSFMQIGHEFISVAILSPYRWFKLGSCQLLAKGCALSTG